MKSPRFSDLFFFIYTAPTEFYTLSLHDALPISGIQSATSRQNTKDQAYAQNEMLAYQQKESTARVDKQASHFVHIPGLSYSEIGRAVQQECRDRNRMPSPARKKKEQKAIDQTVLK